MTEGFQIPHWMVSPRNWTEDFTDENGCYENRCVYCKKCFLGYKRRVVCKLCETTNGGASCLEVEEGEAEIGQ